MPKPDQAREERIAMEIVVEARSGDASEPERAALAERLAAAVKARIGATARVKVGAPGSVERSGGKAKRVVDRRAG